MFINMSRDTLYKVLLNVNFYKLSTVVDKSIATTLKKSYLFYNTIIFQVIKFYSVA